MGYRSYSFQNTYVVHWVGEPTLDDMTRILEETKLAFRRIGEPFVCVSIISDESSFPSSQVLKRMQEGQVELLQYQRSTHLVVVKGNLFVRMLSSILPMMNRSGGKVYYHKSLQEALERAKTHGPLQTDASVIIKTLKDKGVPIG